MAFKILDLDIKHFSELCHNLEAKVQSDNFSPDIVIEIPRGGLRMRPYIYSDIDHDIVTLIRPEKGQLKRMLKSIIKIAPRRLNNFLRILEAKWLVTRTKHMTTTEVLIPDLPINAKRALIIDDAVDSGATLKAIVDKFADKKPEIEIRTAVITVTGDNPSYKPDYYLFNDSSLIRTPWALDSPYKA